MVPTPKTQKWVGEVETELAVVKVTMSKLNADSAPYVDTVQSYRRNSETEKGRLPV